MMRRNLFFGAAFLLVFCSCTSTKISVNDIEVPKKFAREIAVLQNLNYPTNSKEKYEAAMTIYEEVDLTYARSAEKIYEIFSRYDVRLSSGDTTNTNLLFRYEYQDKFIRFLFSTYNGQVIRFECDTETTIAKQQNVSSRTRSATPSNVVNPIPSSSPPMP